MKEFKIGRFVFTVGYSYAPDFFIDRQASILDRLKKQRRLLNVHVAWVWATFSWRFA